MPLFGGANGYTFTCKGFNKVQPDKIQNVVSKYYLYMVQKSAMTKAENYLEINKRLWNEKTDYHLRSEFYNVDSFLQGKNSLNDIELGLLGDIKGKRVLHLQCHFGQDTLSLARLGAVVTGVDFSEKAIASANALQKQTGLNARFICCDIYNLAHYLNETFDVVFTSYGTIGWLPDLMKWAAVLSRFLKPGGAFVFAEFHPVVWMFDANFQHIAYNYFKDGPIIETENGTYADKSADIKLESISWNHSIGEVLNSLLLHDLCIEAFNEYDYSPYNCFNAMQEFEPGKFRVKHLGNNLPMVYSIKALKK